MKKITQKVNLLNNVIFCRGKETLQLIQFAVYAHSLVLPVFALDRRFTVLSNPDGVVEPSSFMDMTVSPYKTCANNDETMERAFSSLYDMAYGMVNEVIKGIDKHEMQVSYEAKLALQRPFLASKFIITCKYYDLLKILNPYEQDENMYVKTVDPNLRQLFKLMAGEVNNDLPLYVHLDQWTDNSLVLAPFVDENIISLGLTDEEKMFYSIGREMNWVYALSDDESLLGSSRYPEYEYSKEETKTLIDQGKEYFLGNPDNFVKHLLYVKNNELLMEDSLVPVLWNQAKK